MGIMMVTSLSSYANNMKMAARWQKRQEEGDYTPDKTEFVDKSFQNQVEEKDDSQNKRSEQTEMDIDIKLTAGKKLNAEEMSYLKAHDPAMYQKAKTIEGERKAYEKALESCKTKEEVEQLKAQHAEAAVKRIRTIWKSSGISREKKRELLKMEHMKAAALDDAMHEFMDSKEYEFLPEGTKSLEGGKDAEGTGADKEKANFGLDPETLLNGEAETVKIERETVEYDLEAVIAEHKAGFEIGIEAAGQKVEEETAAAGQTIEEEAAAAGQKVGEETAAAGQKIEKETAAKQETAAAEGADKKAKYPVINEPSDDAGEEGSITRAIFDEEARLAREDQENAEASRNTGGIQAETGETETPESLRIRQAQGAYLSAQPYAAYMEIPKIDVRK